jgi:prefoldin alpha subunit
VFVNASLTNASSILIGVGAGVVIEKTIDEAIVKLEERMKRIQENLEKMVSLGQRIQADAEELSQKTQHMMEETQR